MYYSILDLRVTKKKREGEGKRVSGFGFRVSSFGFQVSGFGFWVSNFGFRVKGFGLRGQSGGGKPAASIVSTTVPFLRISRKKGNLPKLDN